jgi:preprotein translocase subunit YajC
MTPHTIHLPLQLAPTSFPTARGAFQPARATWTELQDPAQPAAPAGEAATTTAPQDPGAAPAGKKPGLFDSFMFPMLAIFAIFYFVMIAPERKARKKREGMLQALKKGDRVLTTSGMFAVVAAVGESDVTLQIDDGVRARFTRAAIQTVVDGDAAPAKDAPAKK